MIISRHQIIKYIIFLVLLISITFFFIVPYFKNIKKISLALQTEASSLETQYQSGDDLEKAKAVYEYFKDRLPDLKTIFLKKGEELDLITKLEQLAAQYDLEQSLTLAQEGETVGGLLQKTPFAFTLKGDFTDFVGYLDKLVKLNYNLSIESLDLKQQFDGEIIEAKINGHAYWLKI